MKVRPATDLEKWGKQLLRIAILTSTETRHRYFVQALRARLPVVAVGYEETGYHPATAPADDLTPAEQEIVAHHFAERTRQEERFFGNDSEFVQDSPHCRAMRIAPKCLNTEDTLAFLRQSKADTVVVYGTNLIKPPLLGRWPGRMINLHLGLSPYYRGTATNFYPLLNEEPEYVGATVHQIDAGIDSGPIYRHARPRIVADDMPHTIGCKAIAAGIEALISVVSEMAEKLLDPVAPWPVQSPRLYLRRDYHPSQVVKLYRKLEEGLIPKYVERAPVVAPLVRLVN